MGGHDAFEVVAEDLHDLPAAELLHPEPVSRRHDPTVSRQPTRVTAGRGVASSRVAARQRAWQHGEALWWPAERNRIDDWPHRRPRRPGRPAEEQQLLGALRRGDEAAFARLVETLRGSMLRLAMVHVGDRAVAEEVVQDAWLGVLGQPDRFEGRSSLKT
jgi:Sigma-70 region 2